MGQRKVTDLQLHRAKAHAKARGFSRLGGFEYARPLPDGRWLYLSKLPNGELRLGVAQDANTPRYIQAWDYGSKALAAWRAILGWDGKDAPLGWVNTVGQRKPQRAGPDTIDPGEMSNAELLWRFVNGAVFGTTTKNAHLVFKELSSSIPTFALQQAEQVIERMTRAGERLYFEFFEYRSLKIDLSERPLRIDLYDRENGAGAAARALGLDDLEVC